MHLLNYFFTPFGVLLIIFAILFSEPEKNITYTSIAILVSQFIVNFFISKNIYRYYRHMHQIRISLVLFNIFTSAIIFYLLSAYWAPMWLLFIIPSTTGSMFLKRWGTLFISLISSTTMLFIYYFRSIIFETQLSSHFWAMAICHALFIIVLSMFLNFMSGTMLKIRDTMLKK